jgi:uncharacterized protein (DUF433 family)
LVNLPEVRGGNAIVEGTRIWVHDVFGLIVNGSTSDDVVRGFPDLTRAQVYECLAYYEDHRAEIDPLVARRPPPVWGSRDRLSFLKTRASTVVLRKSGY